MGENRVEIVPVVNGKAVLSLWEDISAGVEKVCEFSVGEVTPAQILNEIASGAVTLHIVFIEGKYSGFCTLSFQDDRIQMKRTLFVNQVYLLPEVNKADFLDGLIRLYEIAQKSNADQMVFWTVRDKAWEKSLKTAGWSPRFVEFYKEVEK